MIGETEVIDHIERLQVEEELLAFVFVPQKSASLVESAQKLSLAKKLTQMIGKAFFLERKAHESTGHAYLGLDLG